MRLVSIAAPPGFGKTAALAEWSTADRRPFAWLRICPEDNDVTVFEAGISTALDRAGARRGAASVLVLDDVHRLTAGRAVTRLRALITNPPEGRLIVLSGRRPPPISLPRLRAAGEVLEIGPRELALDREQSGRLLEELGGVADTLRPGIVHRAEGWAAGLRLAGLGLQGIADDVGDAAAAARARMYVADYVREEQLSGMDPERREFLMRTSVLERISPGLAEALTVTGGRCVRLRDVAAANPFLTRVDERPGWYRYNRLYREVLLAELDETAPGLAPQLHRIAAVWLAEHGAWAPAVEHALAADDPDLAASLMATPAVELYAQGRLAAVERWLEPLDDPELLVRHPTTAQLGVLVHLAQGRGEAADRWAELGGRPPLVEAVACRRGVDQQRTDAAQAVAEVSAFSPLRATALVLLGVSRTLSGDAGGGAATLQDAAACADDLGAAEAAALARSELAVIALGRGDGAAAAVLIDGASRLLEDPAVDHPSTALLLALRGRIALQRGELGRARADLSRARRLRRRLTSAVPWLAVQTRLELAQVHLALADSAGARTMLLEIDDILYRRPSLGAICGQVDVLRSRLAGLAELSHGGWASTLTPAELRLLPLLATHLSFREIGQQLSISRNTVKTQAISIYRKLGVTSRTAALRRATDLGLVQSRVGGAAGAPAAPGPRAAG
ncbi:MAG TPA: LuxR C-terminal-related transcriptional regulator [Gaiellales bacterium]|nr:LuxR C-terminal-related transcriptional regulator [Gaiellales bacterium]